MSKTTNLTFAEAMQALVEGKKVRRESWHDETYWQIYFSDAVEAIDPGERSHAIIYNQSITATDWQIID